MQIMKNDWKVSEGKEDGCLVQYFSALLYELNVSFTDQFMSPRETFVAKGLLNIITLQVFFYDLCELIVNSPIRKLHNIKVTRD